MCQYCKYYTRKYKKKLNSQGLSTNKSEDFAEQYTKAVALLRFYFKLSLSELKELDIDDFSELYVQLNYALEFDAIRSSGDPKKKLTMPL